MSLLKIVKSTIRTKGFKEIGNFSIIEKGEYYHKNNIEIGFGVYIGPGASISANGGLTIGDGTIIGPKITIYTSNHNFNSNEILTIPYDHKTINRAVKIENNIWIGGNVVILPGTIIKEGAIIGAGEVVRGEVPAFSIFVNGKVQSTRKNVEIFRKLQSENKIYMIKKWEKYEKTFNFIKKIRKYI